MDRYKVRDITKVGKSSGLETLSVNGWGGARNASVSAFLTQKQLESLYGAARRAVKADMPFNRFVTVHWAALGVSDCNAARATGRLIKLAADWCATKQVKMPWAWVRENDEGDGSKGSHVHIVLHCPAHVQIGLMWRRWLRRITNSKYRRGAVCSRSIGPTLTTYESNLELYAENLASVLAYMSKGRRESDAQMLDTLHIESTGKIIGKRAAWWQAARMP